MVNRRESIQRIWWRYGWERPIWRTAVRPLASYIGTCRTAKHRVFQRFETAILPESKVVAIALGDWFHQGILSSRIHVCWALATGTTLGPTPNYNHADCFNKFPFALPTCQNADAVRRLAEKLDTFRKQVLNANSDLTMTAIYNTLDKLRSGAELSAKDRAVHQKGLVAVLKQIHDELDAAVFDAYGWPHDLTDEEILERLVALNHERAEEEKSGLIRWLRPEFQNPASGKQSVQTELELEADDEDSDDESETPKTKGGKSKGKAKAAGKPKDKAPAKATWPKKLREQITVVRQTLQDHKGPTSSEAIAKRFKSVKANDVEELLDTLASIGQARLLPDGRYAI